MSYVENAAMLGGVFSDKRNTENSITNLHVISGEVISKSEDGQVDILMDGLVFSEEDTQEVTIDAIGGLEEGDTTTILLAGESGHGMTPLAIGSIGSIDRIVLRVSEIEADYIKTEQLEAVEANVETLQANTADINVIRADSAKIHNLTAEELSAASGYISDLTADNVTAEKLSAASGYISDLTADNVTAEKLSAASGYISDLTADNVTAEKLSAASGYISDLTADNVTAEKLSAASGYISDLTADNVTAEKLSAASGYIGDLTTNNITAQNIVADHATVGNIGATYARIDAANINTAAIRDAWVDKIMIQSGLLAHEGTVFTLDAIQVNASNIKAGTLDVDRLLVTGSDGEKYLMHIDSSGATEYQKLDGGVIEDLTITADKIIAGAITAEKITTENIVGTGGWINLRSGTFAYMNATTGQGIAWDGSNLSIAGNVRIHNTTMTLEEVVETANSAKQTALDGAFLVLTSTNGQLFKNGSESTIIQVAIFPNGGDRCDTIAQVRARFGSSAYIEWKWMHESSGEWGTLLSNDPHISRDGMWLTVTPEDVATKTTFSASLVVPD